MATPDSRRNGHALASRQCAEIDLGPEVNKEQGNGKALTDSRRVVVRRVVARRAGRPRADGESSDEDRRAEPVGQPCAAEQRQQRHSEVQPPCVRATSPDRRTNPILCPSERTKRGAATSNNQQPPTRLRATLPVVNTIGNARTVAMSATAIHTVHESDTSDRSRAPEAPARPLRPSWSPGSRRGSPDGRGPDVRASTRRHPPRARHGQSDTDTLANADRSCRSRTGTCVPTTNISNAKPIAANPASRGSLGSTHSKPLLPDWTPAESRQRPPAGPNLFGEASSGPRRPAATTIASGTEAHGETGGKETMR